MRNINGMNYLELQDIQTLTASEFKTTHSNSLIILLTEKRTLRMGFEKGLYVVSLHKQIPNQFLPEIVFVKVYPTWALCKDKVVGICISFKLFYEAEGKQVDILAA